MAIRLHCDRCGRYVSSIGEPKDLAVFKKETICKYCEKTEEKLIRMADTLRGQWTEAINKIIQDAKDEVHSEVAKIKASHGKED
jgi:hypothetical protein